MTPYMVVGISLAAIALIESRRPSWRAPSALATAVLVLFGGLRFETGYDWPAYIEFYEEIPSMGELIAGVPVYTTNAFEPLFLLVNASFRELNAPIELLFFAITLANMLVMLIVVRKISVAPAFVLAVYFCVVFLMAQMTMLRQALASSCVLIGLVYLLRGRVLLYLLWIVIALGFHVSAALFLLLTPFARFRIPYWFAILSCLTAWVAQLRGWSLFSTLLGIGASVVPGPIGDKLALYADAAGHEVSLATVFYAVTNVCALAILYLMKTEGRMEERLANLAIAASLLLIMALTMFGDLVSVWARVMLVVVPIQVAALSRLPERFQLFRVSRSLFVGATCVAAIGLLGYQLQRPSALGFVPYQSLISTWLWGDTGDGELRQQEAAREFKQQ